MQDFLIDVESLSNLPSLKDSYFLAGILGRNNIIRRLDILETPYPVVVAFLECNEFMLTSFWNSRNNKSARIKLVEEMINKGCAGLGIMPGPYLNDVIDKEIISLGNEHNFPIIYIPSNCRWSDILTEFFELSKRPRERQSNINTCEFLDAFCSYKQNGDISFFCNHFSNALSLPIVIQIADNVLYSQNLSPANLLPKLLNKTKSFGDQSTFRYYYVLTKDTYGISYKNENITISTIASNSEISSKTLDFFFDATSYFCNFCYDGKSTHRILKNVEDDSKYYHFMLVFYRNPEKLKAYADKGLWLYEINESKSYATILIEEEMPDSMEDNTAETLYNFCEDTLHRLDYRLVIFSSVMMPLSQIRALSKFVLREIPNIDLIEGIFSPYEIILQYLLTNVPYSVIENILSVFDENLYLNISDADKDSLRLFLSTGNFNLVALLQNIHINTVKYRLNKVGALQAGSSSNHLDLLQLGSLIPLEILKIWDIL